MKINKGFTLHPTIVDELECLTIYGKGHDTSLSQSHIVELGVSLVYHRLKPYYDDKERFKSEIEKLEKLMVRDNDTSEYSTG